MKPTTISEMIASHAEHQAQASTSTDELIAQLQQTITDLRAEVSMLRTGNPDTDSSTNCNECQSSMVPGEAVIHAKSPKFGVYYSGPPICQQCADRYYSKAQS